MSKCADLSIVRTIEHDVEHTKSLDAVRQQQNANLKKSLDGTERLSWDVAILASGCEILIAGLTGTEVSPDGLE